MNIHARFLIVLGLAAAASGCGTSDSESSDGSSDAGAAGAPGVTFPAAVPDDCITDVTAGVHELMCAGSEVTFKLTVPADCLDQACGLILDVHGALMNGDMESEETELDRLGRDNGYISIHPTAVVANGNPLWNIGPDNAVLVDFVERVVAAFHVDEKRVHMTGFSQGGVLTWQLICQNPGLFASAAPAAAALGSSSDATGICAGGTMPDPALPILFLHGTTDELSPYSVALLQRDTIVRAWDLQQEEVVQSDDTHTWTRYTNEGENHFEFIEHDYESDARLNAILGGHCYPGSRSGGGLACEQDAAFHWGEAAMQFFLDHPKK